jgi:hypothetical protein
MQSSRILFRNAATTFHPWSVVHGVSSAGWPYSARIELTAPNIFSAVEILAAWDLCRRAQVEHVEDTST